METIFDHGITQDEARKVFGLETPEDLQWYKERDLSHNTRMAAIAMLYLSRGNLEAAKEYIERIQDEGYRLSIRMALLHPDLVR